MTKVILVTSTGEVDQLAESVEAIVRNAEARARDENRAKRSVFPSAIRDAIEAAGYQLSEADLAMAVTKFEAVRRGEVSPDAAVRVSCAEGRFSRRERPREELSKTHVDASNQRFFEAELTYPDSQARARYERLVGLDDHKARLLLELELLLYPDRLEDWSRRYHGAVLALCEGYRDRPPLVLLEGDVGCGKTALAETIGDKLASEMKTAVHLLRVNTQVRGTGLVGEMTDLIVQAFALCEARAAALNGPPILLLIDEADALAARRDQQHMHHEDKAGLNTLLQRIDGLRRGQHRVVVLFITNRPDVLDPAVRRRAALRLVFQRPGVEARKDLFRRLLPELKLTNQELAELAKATGPRRKRTAGCTPSDITDRIVPAAVREAYAARRALTAGDVVAQARLTDPTPALSESPG